MPAVSSSRYLVMVSWDDVPHLTAQAKAELLESYPEHEREARTKGLPIQGSGKIFKTLEERIKIDPIPLPKHWPRIAGLDVGIDHPTAAVWLAWDRETDILYVYDEYKEADYRAQVHAGPIRARGPWVPMAWPHDAHQRDKGSGEQLHEIYKSFGVAMLPEHAAYPDDRGYSTEAVIMDCANRFETGRIKVFSHLTKFLEEYRMYHRKDGKIVKLMDDLLSALFKAVMMQRFAQVEPTAENTYRAFEYADSGAGY